MAYVVHTYRCGKFIERVFLYRGDEGGKNEKAGPRRKRTKEEIARQNLTNKINRILRIIRTNFRKDDYWLSLTFRKEERRPP